VPPGRLATAPPGIERKPTARGSTEGVPRLLCVGAVVPRKDHATLIEALAGLADRPWRLTVVGNRTRAAAHAAALEGLAAELGLSSRVEFAGELEDADLAPLWLGADLYVSPSAFEGYGSALAEAVAAGLPVVTTAAGAVPGWLEPRADLVVPVGDVPGVRAAIARVLDEPGLRRSLRAGALAARDALPTWESCVDAVEAALARV
jgi:glycosyltransferase involved in cell wall biosynthesis